MITAPTYQGKTIGVFGLARTGVAAVKALRASGATVWAWDDMQARRDAVGSAAKDLYRADFAGLDALLLAPGVPLTHPTPHALVTKAWQAGVPLISDFDIFEAARAALPYHHCIGITGTNGKSTTTALIGHMIAACGRPVAIGGNIGKGVLSLDPVPAGGVYVFEMSSFQLDLTHSFMADIGVLLNLSPDHLDRHGDMAGYIAAKKRLFDMQDDAGVAVLGRDDADTRAVEDEIRGEAISISGEQQQGDVFVADGRLMDAMSGSPVAVGRIAEIETLQGTHNWQNAAAAYAVGRKLGLSPADIFASFRSFAGLAHRQELVAERQGVRYVNDSKATNVDAAVRALSSFDHIHWIAGGRPKDKSFEALMAFKSRIKHAYLLGEAADALAHMLRDEIPYSDCRDMAHAVARAARRAEDGDTVLLSPACTAFDQFTDFEARGEAFRAAVGRLGDVS